MTQEASSLIARLPSRSLGLKLLLVCALALLMAIPSLFVFLIVLDRTNRAEQAEREIGALVGGPQNFMGPVLLVPYTVKGGANTPPPRQPTSYRGNAATTDTTMAAAPAQNTSGVYVIFPKTGEASASVATEVRKRGIFTAPVWTADLVMASTFDLATAGTQAPSGATLDWSRAEIVVGASDARGAKSDITLDAGRGAVSMTPARALSGLSINAPPMQDGREPFNAGLRLFGAPAGDIARPGARFSARATARFAGARRIGFLAYAEQTSVCALGDWEDPDFAQSAFPTERQGGCDAAQPAASEVERNFTGFWSVPYIARGVASEGTVELLEQLGGTAMQVRFFQKANPYTPIQRSVKYAPMFLGLVFLAYFLFETRQRRRIHAAQYVLIGLAQTIFYMLLLSIAEQVGFDLAFLIAGGATVGLISAYAGWVFESRRQGWTALAVFSALYLLIYVLMRIEDYALLVGAVASFLAIAAAMYFTRNIDWYGASPATQPAPTPKKGA